MYIRLKLSALVASCKSEERLRQATGLYSRTLSHFLYPGWDASPSQGYPQHYVRRYPFGESEESCPRTQHSVPGQGSNQDLSIRRRAH